MSESIKPENMDQRAWPCQQRMYAPQVAPKFSKWLATRASNNLMIEASSLFAKKEASSLRGCITSSRQIIAIKILSSDRKDSTKGMASKQEGHNNSCGKQD